MFWILLYIACLFSIILISVVLTFLIYIAIERRRYKDIPGPPISSFLFGHVPEFKKLQKKDGYRHDLLLEWAQKYGPVYKVFFIHKCMIIASSPACVKELLTRSKYPKSGMVYKNIFGVFGERFMGRGFVTNTDHEEWKQRRAAVNPAFHKKYLRTFISQFNEIADDWVSKLNDLADGSTYFSMADLLYRVTLETIGKIAFNMDLGAIDDNNNTFPMMLHTVLHGMSCGNKDPLYRLKPKNRQIVGKVQKSVRYIRQRCREVIIQRIQDINNGKQVPTDILTFLLQTLENMPQLGIEDIVDDFATVFIAGQETTSNTLCFLLGEVGRHPQVLQKLEKEISTVIGDDNYITYDHVGRLEYMHQVWSESLRLYPPAPATVREIVHPTELEGVQVPAKSTVIIPFYVIHRLPQHYENSLQFNPDRFGPAKPRAMYTYLPFSLGQRACVGKQFAQIEGKILLCKFLQRFKFTLDPDQSFAVSESTTLRPKGGTVMSIQSRQ